MVNYDHAKAIVGETSAMLIEAHRNLLNCEHFLDGKERTEALLFAMKTDSLREEMDNFHQQLMQKAQK